MLEEQLFDALLTTADEAILVLTPDLVVMRHNPSAEALLDVQSLERLSIAELRRGALSYFASTVQHAIQSERNAVNADIAIRDRVCHVSIRKGGSHWIVRVRDETPSLANLYRMRELAAEAEDIHGLLRTALDGVPVGIIIVDAQGHLRHVNQFVRDHIGYELELNPPEMFGEAVGLLDADGTTPRHQSRQSIWRALKGEIVTEERIVLRNNLSGQAIFVSANAMPFRNRKGEIAGAVGWYFLLSYLTAAASAADAIGSPKVSG